MRLSALGCGLAAILIGVTGVAADGVGEIGGLSEPLVIIEADPPPPFTYWAPEGSTIVNHPNGEGVWIAEQNGERAAYYFGDLCKASEFQGLVGQPLDRFPAGQVGEHLRTACTECAVTSDLRFSRVNVWFDQDTSIIEEISCG